MEQLLDLAHQLLTKGKPIPLDVAAQLLEAGIDVERIEQTTRSKE